MMELLAWTALLAAVATALSFFRNWRQFQRAACIPPGDTRRSISVLIPARDEAPGITATLESVLANEGVTFEVVVWDDQSEDATPQIVQSFAARDARVRLLPGEPLPAGWCGKQHACARLATHARHDTFLFLDADVRLAPDALTRALAERERSEADLLSGFPRQEVGTLSEGCLIPLMYIVLLTYLPFARMRAVGDERTSAGCGQFFLCTRHGYERSGGHAAIRASLHDGLMLPRAFRRAGLKTDVFDAGDIARCRMYRGWSQTCRGLMKNAHEGIANPRLIVPATVLMFAGYAGPTCLAVQQWIWPASPMALTVASLAAFVSYLPRLATAWRFDRSLIATLLLPCGVLLFLLLQWGALLRSLRGARTQWRGRAYSTEPVSSG